MWEQLKVTGSELLVISYSLFLVERWTTTDLSKSSEILFLCPFESFYRFGVFHFPGELFFGFRSAEFELFYYFYYEPEAQ